MKITELLGMIGLVILGCVIGAICGIGLAVFQHNWDQLTHKHRRYQWSTAWNDD